MSDRLLFIVVGTSLAAWLLVGLVEFALVLRDQVKAAHEVQYRPESVELPVRCKQYYNDGTNQWKDCMGVGYVREEDDEHD